MLLRWPCLCQCSYYLSITYFSVTPITTFSLEDLGDFLGPFPFPFLSLGDLKYKCIFVNYDRNDLQQLSVYKGKYSQTCIKRSPLGQRKSGLIRQVTSKKRLNSYEMFYARTRKGWPLNTGDCLIVVTAWTGLPVYLISLTEFSMYVGDRLSHLPD
jgi:hypothetical protein